MSEMNQDNSYKVVKKTGIRYEHLNTHGSLFGGVMLAWIDEASAIYAMEIMKTKSIVTLKISEVIFKLPVRLGDIAEFSCKPIRFGKTSLTIAVRVRSYNIEEEGQSEDPIVCEAEITFVSVDKDGKPTIWNKQG